MVEGGILANARRQHLTTLHTLSHAVEDEDESEESGMDWDDLEDEAERGL